jgi:MFS family permease
LHVFLTFLIISLIGNACADFALIWYSVARMGADAAASSHLLTAFYVGQSIGVVILAPVFSAIVDRHSKRRSAIVLDSVYAAILMSLLLVYATVDISPAILLPFAVLTASLGSLHKNAIGYGALKSLSTELGTANVVSKFTASLYFTNALGATLSGFCYQWLGLSGCLWLAILTFIPMPFIYMKLFPEGADQPVAAARRDLFAEVIQGFRFLKDHRDLLVITLSLAAMNFVSNIYPAVVGIAFQHLYPGKTWQGAAAVSLAILIAIPCFGPLQKFAPKLRVKDTVWIALAGPIVLALFCVFVPHPAAFAVAFAGQCVAAALCNILSGSLRVKTVPASFTGRVNTAYAAILSTGQIAGGLVLIPLLERSLSLGALAIAACFVVASLISVLGLPSVTLKERLEEKAR